MPSPNPKWKPGDTIASPVDKMVQIDPAQVSALDMYKLLIGSVVPRPIAFVSTLSTDKKGNLAPFSFFNGVSSNPPCVMISVGHTAQGEMKDTLRNIEDTREFVINSSNEWLAEPLVHCAAQYPFGVNEMEKVGLTPIDSVIVKPPRVKESAVHFECKKYGSLPVGNGGPGSTVLIVGEIVMAHVHEAAYRDGKILFEHLKPIGRLGGSAYGMVTDTFEIPIPKVT